ncbi:MAG: phosphoribosyltransferase [Saprospiraceae bacterium]|nr:phosphoribosyltransferase [Saprospiraceae bacterium]
MKILDDWQIKQKIRRLAIEILEQNYDEKELILAGINNNGMEFANLLLQQLLPLAHLEVTLTRVVLNPANPLSSEVKIEMPSENLQDKVIVIIDDVANTGRTIFYACKPFMEVLPRKLEVAVLVDRKHKSFPVKVDYVGLSLATTLKEHIDVHIRETDAFAVYLN